MNILYTGGWLRVVSASCADCDIYLQEDNGPSQITLEEGIFLTTVWASSELVMKLTETHPTFGIIFDSCCAKMRPSKNKKRLVIDMGLCKSIAIIGVYFTKIRTNCDLKCKCGYAGINIRVPRCPECNEARCAYCRVEYVQVR